MPEAFDPLAINRRLTGDGVLDPPEAPPEGPLGADEKYFTEYNARLYALWRISMARQIHPHELVQMPEEDLLFLAGQTSKGYPEEGLAGIALEANKVDGNAIRARAELTTRATRLARRHALMMVVVGAVLGSALTLAGTYLSDDAQADQKPSVATTATTASVATTTTPTTTAGPTTTTTR